MLSILGVILALGSAVFGLVFIVAYSLIHHTPFERVFVHYMRWFQIVFLLGTVLFIIGKACRI